MLSCAWASRAVPSAAGAHVALIAALGGAQQSPEDCRGVCWSPRFRWPGISGVSPAGRYIPGFLRLCDR